MWHKAEWMGRPMRLELTRVGLLVNLANRYTTRGAQERWNNIIQNEGLSVIINNLLVKWSIVNHHVLTIISFVLFLMLFVASCIHKI